MSIALTEPGRELAHRLARVTTSMVDWTVALNTATKLVKPGPEISREGAAEVVAELRSFSPRGGVRPRGHRNGSCQRYGPRAGCRSAALDSANLDGFRQILAPLNAKMIERMKQSNPTIASLGPRSQASKWARCSAICRRRSSVSSTHSSREPTPTHRGRLLLVAPNIVSIERELDVEPADFRLWVCLHEETHQVQFAQFRGCVVISTLRSPRSSTRPSWTRRSWQMLRDALRRVIEGRRIKRFRSSTWSRRQRSGKRSIAEPVMSLLEGHADVVMDGRSRSHSHRGNHPGQIHGTPQGQGFDKIIRKLLGLDAKMRQYRDGAKFCRAVMAEVGMSGLNKVWTYSETLPTSSEISNPRLWLARMHLS